MNNTNIPAHFEKFIGRITKGWSDADGPGKLQVVCFYDSPRPGMTTFATLGLSKTPLILPSGNIVLQEIVFSILSDNRNEERIANCLLYVADSLIIRKEALLRGEVFALPGPILEYSVLTHLYSSKPTIFESNFAEITTIDPPAIFPLLIAISSAEAESIALSGWSAFEQNMANGTEDLFDLSRKGEI